MMKALDRIADDFEAFRAAIERCQSASAFQRADWQDAVARLARVRDRYNNEKALLTDSERRALAKVFEHDRFIEGMMVLRQISEHVRKRRGVTIRTVDNTPIELECETSARAVVAAPKVAVADTRGHSHQIDHLQQLREAERRIFRALQNARS